MRIHIIGGPGSGKSYAAKELSKILKIKTCHLDDLFWDKKDKDFTQRRSQKKRDVMVSSISMRKSWITEGAFTRDWISPFIKKADIILIITPNRFIRALRIIKRSWQRRLGVKKKESIIGLFHFLKWNYHYDKKNLIRGIHLIAKLKKKAVYLYSADDAIAYLRKQI